MAELLREEIRRGELPPGTRLRQEDVANRLGVSTTPVREAFQALKAQGVLTLDPHRGVVVFRPTAQDVLESYEIREALEELAIEKTIPHLASDSLAELQGILDEMKTAIDDERWIELNSRFHRRLHEISGRERLANIIDSLANATSPYVRMVVRDARRTGRGDSGHQAILDACAARDVKAARAAVRAHLDQTVQQTLRLLERSRDESAAE